MAATKTAENLKICPACGYRWNARVPHPKECPECKHRLRQSK